jgi:hypothetical protein
MKHDTDIAVFSINDIIKTYKDYDASEEAKEPILYFVSELTGLSIDSLDRLMK